MPGSVKLLSRGVVVLDAGEVDRNVAARLWVQPPILGNRGTDRFIPSLSLPVSPADRLGRGQQTDCLGGNGQQVIECGRGIGIGHYAIE